MSIENRKHLRKSPPVDLEKGKGFRCSDMECFEIEMVKDISIHGIGLMADTFLAKGVSVELKLPRSQKTSKMYGQVAWACPVKETLADKELPLSYWLGISLN